MQKTSTQPLSILPSWDGGLPGAVEFAALLNTFTDAVMVINRTSRQRFKDAFEAVNTMFVQVFPRLFRGGEG